MRKERHCYYHVHHRPEFLWLNIQQKHNEVGSIQLPVLEDASSIQSAIGQIMSLLLQDQIDSKKAGLLLYALQTASSNLKSLGEEPKDDMHCDPEITARNPLRDWEFSPWELEVMEKSAAEDQRQDVLNSQKTKALVAELDKQSQHAEETAEGDSQPVAEIHAAAPPAVESAKEQPASRAPKKKPGSCAAGVSRRQKLNRRLTTAHDRRPSAVVADTQPSFARQEERECPSPS